MQAAGNLPKLWQKPCLIPEVNFLPVFTKLFKLQTLSQQNKQQKHARSRAVIPKWGVHPPGAAPANTLWGQEENTFYTINK